MSKNQQLLNEKSFYLNDWKISPKTSTASKGSEHHELSKKMALVILYLAKHQRRVVSRAELIDNLWDGKYQAGEKALNTTIWELRKLFETDHAEEKYIQTIHRKGYKLLVKPVYKTSVLKNNFRPVPVAIISLLAVACVAIIYLQIKNISPKDEEWPRTRVTDLAGREVSPAPSPDGKYLAFHWLPSNTRPNLFIKSLEDPKQSLKQITFTKDNERRPTWSPDSKYIAFARTSTTSSKCELHIVNIETLIERPLGDCRASSKVRWSHDGHWLAYVGRPKGSSRTGIYMKDMRSYFNISGTPKNDVRVCCDNDRAYGGINLSWSNDSTMLALTRKIQAHSEDIYIYKLSDASLQQITNDIYLIDGIDWTKDDRNILFTNVNEYSRPTLFQVNIYSGEIIDLEIHDIDSPIYSHDHSELFYYLSRKDDAVHKIYLDKNKGQIPSPVVDTSYHEYISDYSPQLKKILVRRNLENRNQILIADTDGRNIKEIVSIKGKSSYPSWSYTGKYIAFFTRCPKGNCINLLDIDTQKIVELKTPFQNHYAFNWANNDTDLLVPARKDGKRRIWRIPVSGEPPVQITQSNASAPQLSDDRKYLYYYRGRKNHQIYRMPYPQGKEELVIDNTNISWASWALAKNGIYFINKHIESNDIEFFDFKTKERHVLVTIPKQTISGNHPMQYIEAENALIFTRIGPQQYDIYRSPDPYIPN